MKRSNEMVLKQFLNDLQTNAPEQRQILDAVRALYLAEGPELNEDIKYKGLVFIKAGELLAGVFPYQHHLSVEFSQGVAFNDPAQLLEGQGKARRHLKLRSFSDIKAKQVTYYIKQSLAI